MQVIAHEDKGVYLDTFPVFFKGFCQPCANELIYALRGTAKNKDVPVIVYTPAAGSGIGLKDAERIGFIKRWCEKMGMCEFMEKGYTGKHFAEISKKYLQTFQ